MKESPDFCQQDGRREDGIHEMLLEKLGEKLGYERAFLRLYESFVHKKSLYAKRYLHAKSYEQKIFENFAAMKAAHCEILQTALIGLGGNPDHIVPSEDLAAIARLGIVTVFIHPHAKLKNLFHAVRIVELTGKSTTLFLIRLAYAAGAEDLANHMEILLEECEEILRIFPGQSFPPERPHSKCALTVLSDAFPPPL